MTKPPLFTGQFTYLAGADRYEILPSYCLPEFAFIGRSNVGKSSTINTLIGNQSCARKSHTPGRTQKIHAFSIKERLIIVDLPGYGYAKLSKGQSLSISTLIQDYIQKRAALRRVFVLIDARRGIMPIDIDCFDWLDHCGTAFSVILTKIDKTGALAQKIDAIRLALRHYSLLDPNIFAISNTKKEGINPLRLSLTEELTALKRDI